MERIVVVGCGGAGKSVVALRLAEVLDLPVTHLDGVYYDTDWDQLAADEFAAAQRQLVARSRWVIDGNYASTLPIRLNAADTVVFCDLHPVVCLWGIAERRLRYGGGQHPEAGVYDRVNLSFLRYVLSYRRKMRPRILDLVAAHAAGAQLITLTSRRHTAKLIGRAQATVIRPRPSRSRT